MGFGIKSTFSLLCRILQYIFLSIFSYSCKQGTEPKQMIKHSKHFRLTSDKYILLSFLLFLFRSLTGCPSISPAIPTPPPGPSVSVVPSGDGPARRRRAARRRGNALQGLRLLGRRLLELQHLSLLRLGQVEVVLLVEGQDPRRRGVR